ncbi:MAG: outer membrane protein, partial [Longimicrobiales bacterium]
FVGTDDLPIFQTTEFTRVPVTANVKVYLADRGRSVSRFAWIPSKVAPYVGGGVGIVWYEFVQDGEFVDFNNLDIFSDRLSSSGTSATGQVFGGVDLSLGGIWVLTGEGRYSFGSVQMDEDFVGFDNIDLNGLQMTVGIGVRF